MPKVLVVGPLRIEPGSSGGAGVDAGAVAVETLFHDVAEILDAGGDRADGADGLVHLRIEGRYNPTAPGEEAGRTAVVAAANAARRLEAAKRRLRARGGILTCVTAGIAGGPWLEIALMSDLHLMETDAALVPPSLYDTYVPRAGGWERLLRRAGAGRAATILLADPPEGGIGLKRALEMGLCDGEAPPAGDRRIDAMARAASSTATRLSLELADRFASGGLTPRQARRLERAAFALAFASAHPSEGIAAFFEGRPARFTKEGDGGR